MKRFLLTSHNFSGTAELIYGEQGILAAIDVRNTNMSADARHWLFQFAPRQECDLPAFMSGLKSATIVQEDVEVTFEMFWEKYGKKINKKRCVPLWNKLSKTKQVKAFYGISDYDRFLARETWRSKADPENYLRNEMWENEWK